MKNILIVIASKFGREVLGYIQQTIAASAPWRVKGFLDERKNLLNGFDYDEPILGSPERYSPKQGNRFLCAMGDPVMKKKFADSLGSVSKRQFVMFCNTVE